MSTPEARATRSTRSASARSPQEVIELVDETPANEKEAAASQKLSPSLEVAGAPEESTLEDIKPSLPTLIGESGTYQIFRLRATLHEKETAASAKHFKENIMLGLQFEHKDRMGKLLQTSFKKGHSNYTFINAVKRGSIAERAGALKDDTLVWWSDEGPAPVVFHHLFGGGEDNGGVVWEFINEDVFEAKRPSETLKAFGSFTFYVARPKVGESVSESDESTPATRLSAATVNLGPEIVMRAMRFRSLTVREKATLVQDAQEDARKSFEKDRNAILRSLPKVVTDAFFQIGFAAWGQKKPITYTPVFVLSPFNIPPGPVRLKWLELYKKVSSCFRWCLPMQSSICSSRLMPHVVFSFLHIQKSRNLDTMHHLVYWYGETDPSSQYSLLSQLKFLSLAKGKAKNCHRLPDSIQTKLSRKQNLTAAEEAKVRAQREMEKDLPKSPEERLTGKIPNFAELHCSISSFDLSKLAAGNGTGSSSGKKIARNNKRRSSDERDSKRRANSNKDGALDFSLTAGVPDTSIIGQKPSPTKQSKHSTARKVASTEYLQPPEKRQRRTSDATKANDGLSLVEDLQIRSSPPARASLRETKGSKDCAPSKAQTMSVTVDAPDLPSNQECTATAKPPPSLYSAQVSPSLDGAEALAAPLPSTRSDGDLPSPKPSVESTTAADKEDPSATLPVARENGDPDRKMPAVRMTTPDREAPAAASISAQSNGDLASTDLSAKSRNETAHAGPPAGVGGSEASNLSAIFLKNALQGQKILETNRSLLKQYGELQKELNSLQESHRKKITAFKSVCQEDGDGKDNTSEDPAPDPAVTLLEELLLPRETGDDAADCLEFFHFVPKVALQNAELITACSELKKKISDLNERRAKLHALQQEVATRLEAVV